MSIDYKTRLIGKNNPNYKGSGIKKCKWCGLEFKTYSKKRKFCSVKCSNISHRKDPEITTYVKNYKKINKKVWKCEICSKVVLRKRKYCVECYSNKNKISLKCDECGNMFVKNRCDKTINNYCSSECINRNGNKNPNWKGGITSENKKIRASSEYNDWRISVFSRDKHTCQDCGQVGGKLNAHHIKPFSTNLKCRLDIDNGITLCEECHKKTDSFLSRT